MEVNLYAYDLTNGMAALMGPNLIGRPLEAVWHTSIVVYGTEFFYGQGISTAVPGQTHFGSPRRIIPLGTTSVTRDQFMAYLRQISARYGPYSYHLLDNNCNHFTGDVSRFLTGREIPREIADQPSELINTPIGQMMRPMIEQVFGPSSLPAGAPLVFEQNAPNAPTLASLTAAHPALGASAPTSVGRAKPIPAFLKNRNPSLYPAGQVVTIIAKLKSFIEEEKLDLSCDPASIDQLDKALKSAFNTKTLKLSDGVFQFIDELLAKLPAEKEFPVLDILRLVFSMDPSAVLRFLNPNSASPLIKILRRCGTEFDFAKGKSTAIMATRLACNVFKNGEAAKAMLMDAEYVNVLVGLTVKGLLSGDKLVRETASSLAFNLSLGTLHETPDPAIEIVSALHQALIEESDFEVAYRIVCALGHFLTAHDVVGDLLISLQLDVQLHALSQDDATNPLKTTPESKEKLQTLVKEVLTLLPPSH